MIERLCSSKLWLDSKLIDDCLLFSPVQRTYGKFSMNEKKIAYAHAVRSIVCDRFPYFNLLLLLLFVTISHFVLKRVNSTINRIWKRPQPRSFIFFEKTERTHLEQKPKNNSNTIRTKGSPRCPLLEKKRPRTHKRILIWNGKKRVQECFVVVVGFFFLHSVMNVVYPSHK